MIKKLLTLFFILILTIILFNQEEIIHPKRRTLQPYHYEWLNHPEQHSMEIIKNKKDPEILIVKFNPNAKLSKRAKKIKKELLARGYQKSQLQNNGILMLFHGKNGRKEDLLPVTERYIMAGFTCILADLPAHGENPKNRLRYAQNLEKYFYEEVLTIVEKEIEIKNRPLYFWGMSLGGAFAIASSTSNKRVFQKPKAIILVSTFDNLSYILKEKSINMFGEYMGRVLYQTLRLSLKLFYNFDPKKSDSTKYAKQIDIPIFMLHGKKDKLIDYKHGEALFKSFPTKNKLLHLDNKGNHHNILVTNYPFYLESIDFLLKNKKP